MIRIWYALLWFMTALVYEVMTIRECKWAMQAACTLCDNTSDHGKLYLSKSYMSNIWTRELHNLNQQTRNLQTISFRGNTDKEKQ